MVSEGARERRRNKPSGERESGADRAHSSRQQWAALTFVRGRAGSPWAACPPTNPDRCAESLYAKDRPNKSKTFRNATDFRLFPISCALRLSKHSCALSNSTQGLATLFVCLFKCNQCSWPHGSEEVTYKLQGYHMWREPTKGCVCAKIGSQKWALGTR